MPFSPKQQEYLDNATHRWNVKTGATASGKTFLDYAYVIPRRIENCVGEGLIVLIGNNINSIERNVLAPMREIWPGLVSPIRQGSNTAQIFGKRCFIMGADKVNQVARLQGTTIEYAYGDEVTTWNREFFEMLKSRLRAPNSCFDGTCNPDGPSHWFKEFLDGDADIHQQAYALDDNPFLPTGTAENIKREYAGTVYYDRYVLGKWVHGQGIIYGPFAANPRAYLTHEPDYDFIQLGVDFGGNKSAYAFVATGLKHDYSKLTALCSERHPAKDMTPTQLNELFAAFVARVKANYGAVSPVYCDSAEQTLINGLRGCTSLPICNSIKNPIMDRVRATVALIGSGRFFYTKDCETLRNALCNAVYDDKKLHDERLDNGTSDIDTLDSFEYSWERYLRNYALM